MYEFPRTPLKCNPENPGSILETHHLENGIPSFPSICENQKPFSLVYRVHMAIRTRVKDQSPSDISFGEAKRSKIRRDGSKD